MPRHSPDSTRMGAIAASGTAAGMSAAGAGAGWVCRRRPACAAEAACGTAAAPSRASAAAIIATCKWGSRLFARRHANGVTVSMTSCTVDRPARNTRSRHRGVMLFEPSPRERPETYTTMAAALYCRYADSNSMCVRRGAKHLRDSGCRANAVLPQTRRLGHAPNSTAGPDYAHAHPANGYNSPTHFW